MIGGDKMFNDVVGINKILEFKPGFVWHYLNYIESFKYYIDFNDTFDEISFLEIGFLMREQGKDEKKNKKILIKFNEVNCFDIKDIGGSYNQIMGFEILDQKESRWESNKRYLVRDYEDGCIKFYCRSIMVISVA